jgi:hypothetical protein
MCDWRGEEETCIGVCAAGFSACLAHLGPADLDVALSGLRPGGDLDARGVRFSAELLGRVLAAVRAFEAGPRPRLGAARFSRAHFAASARFDGAQFDGSAWFDGAHFEGSASFDRVQFNADAWFDRARVDGDAQFSGARFNGMNTGFVQAQVSGDAHFDGTRFHGDLSFAGARLERGARFSQARFEGLDTGFAGTQFGGYAWFDSAAFSQTASFAGAQFQDAAWFKEARFDRSANFSQAQFTAVAWFEGARFGHDASFAEARFETAGRLGPLAARRLLLDGATFSHSITLEACAAEVSCNRAVFEQSATLRLRYAMADLTAAVFATAAAVSGADRPFTYRTSATWRDHDRELPEGQASQHAREARQQHHIDAAGQGTPWIPVLTSLASVDVTHLVIIDTDLASCRFAGAHHLDQLSIEGRCRFGYPPGSTRLAGALSRWTRRQVLAEEKAWRGWTPDARPGTGQASSKDDPGIGAERLAALYRSLRKALEDSKNEPGAADFYYGEMEMRRHAPSTPLSERIVLTGYWALCGYGLRATRALAALAALIITAAAIFQHAGFPGRTPGYIDSLLYAAGSVLSLDLTSGHLPATLSRGGEALRILLRIAGPVCLGLAALALRGRVKR